MSVRGEVPASDICRGGLAPTGGDGHLLWKWTPPTIWHSPLQMVICLGDFSPSTVSEKSRWVFFWRNAEVLHPLQHFVLG